MPPSEDPATPRPSAKSIGTHLGRYTIIKLIGRGGVGAVYEADDPELDRRVAIKVLRDDGAGNMDGLRREAQALAKLVHQNVVMVYDVGISGGEVFLVMQRSEEHTSELQSQSNLVCRLLLEKKKNIITTNFV